MENKLTHIADKLPPNFLRVVGEMIVRWSRLQWQLSNLVAVGFNIPKDTSRAFTVRMSTGNICNLVLILTENDRWIKDDTLREEIKCLSKEIMNKVENRNNFAHGAFFFDLDTPNEFYRMVTNSKKNTITPSYEKIDVSQLKQLALEARSLVQRTADLTVKLKASIKKSK